MEGFEKGKSLKPQPLCITLKTKRYMRQKPTSSPISQKKKKERKNYLMKQSKDAIIKWIYINNIQNSDPGGAEVEEDLGLILEHFFRYFYDDIF